MPTTPIFCLGFSQEGNDAEAFTYKADAVLELDEPQWAVNLCQQALAIDPNNSLAYYQLACAYTMLEQFDEAISYLNQALALNENYRDETHSDPALKPLSSHPDFPGITNKPTHKE